VQQYRDTTYITVAPKVMPLLVPLHMIGLGFVANLIEPALRDIVEQTGYDRSIPYGEPTPFRLIPIFDPIKLIMDLIADIPEGIQQALNGGPPPLTPPETVTTSTVTTSTMATSSAAVDPPTVVDISGDGTTKATTSNGAAATLQKTEVSTTSRPNATQSNATEIKQVDPTKPDVTKDPEEIKNATDETKMDVEGTAEAREGTKKKGSGVKVSLNFSPKKPADNDTRAATPGQDEASDSTSPDGTDSEQPAA
jgi:PE-PPE domain